MRLLFRFAVLVMLVYGAWVPTARACTQAPCSPPIRLFPVTGPYDVFPGNLVYFKVLKDDPGPLSLRVKGGDVIPASIRMIGKDRVFAPDAPIASGTEVQLDYMANCFEGPLQQSFVFKTYEPAEVTVREATLEVEMLGLAYPNDRFNEAGFVQLRYYDPDEDGSAYHLLDRTATIDGKLAEIDRESRVKFSSFCDPAKNEYVQDSCGTTRFVPIGEHTVEVRASIVGQASDPPPTRIKVRTACSVRCAAPADAVDVGTGSGQAAGKDSAKPHADLHKAKNISVSTANGCCIGSGAPSHLPLWPLLLSLTVWSIARRERRHG